MSYHDSETPQCSTQVSAYIPVTLSVSVCLKKKLLYRYSLLRVTSVNKLTSPHLEGGWEQAVPQGSALQVCKGDTEISFPRWTWQMLNALFQWCTEEATLCSTLAFIPGICSLCGVIHSLVKVTETEQPPQRKASGGCKYKK